MPLADILQTDTLGVMLVKLIKEFKPKTIIEIGSSDGSGSSTIIAGAIKGTKSQLYCIEAVPSRFLELKRRMSLFENVTCYNVSSVDSSGMMEELYAKHFVRRHRNMNVSKLYPIKLVMEWYKETVAIINSMEIKNGIEYIKKENDIVNFDLAFIDGSPFTGMAELERVYGAKIIVMDDTMDIKCYDPMMNLLSDPNYTLLTRDDRYRNGFAVFKRIAK